MLQSVDAMCVRSPHRVPSLKAHHTAKQPRRLQSSRCIHHSSNGGRKSKDLMLINQAAATSRLSVRVYASGDNGDNKSGNDKQSGASSAGIPAGLLLFVGSAAYTLANMRDELTDLLYSGDSLADLGIAGFGLGDGAGALLWAVALWYVSPLQLLLVFLGKIETDRPSDWLMNKLGRAAQQPVDAIDYVVPLWIRAVAAATCLAGGVTVAGLLSAGLGGDATWAVSSGIGALFGAAVFEVGRPARLTVAEAQQLESQWQDFAAFADARLQRSGRCHESEIYRAFRQRFGKYRSGDVMTDSTLRDMVRNWHPGVERTRTGYLRNISLRPLGPPSSSGSSASSTNSSSAALEQQAAQADAEPSLLDNIAEAAAEEARKQAAAAGTASSGQQ